MSVAVPRSEVSLLTPQCVPASPRGSCNRPLPRLHGRRAAHRALRRSPDAPPGYRRSQSICPSVNTRVSTACRAARLLKPGES